MGLDTSLDETLATLYSAVSQPSLWEVFLAKFASQRAVTKAALMIHDFTRSEHGISTSFGDSVKESVDLYERHYCQFDEWALRLPKSVPPGTILKGSDIWPYVEMRKSTFYNEFLKPFDTCEMALAVGSNSNPRFEVLSIFRGPIEQPFDENHFAALRLLSPHLQIALGMRRRLLTLESRVTDLENALDHLETALVIFDSTAKPVFVNRAARQLSELKDGIQITATRITVQDPTENARLQTIIARAIAAGTRGGKEFGGATLISRADKRPLQALAGPFHECNQSNAPREAVAALFISDPDRAPGFRAEVLRELYGMTSAEARLATMLLTGKSLPELAESLGVTHETVRAQMKSVLHKTGTARQGELVSLLSKLAGGISATRSLAR
jgi:DNA-binding CsgD family transcriptional regulator/PAS domain-containing protein